MNAEPKHKISFAEFELDAAHRRLAREGETLSLHPKAFDLLVFLAENAGRVVTKDEILDAVWANQFVDEGNLKVQMSALRKVLGERKNDHRFLVTIPGKGYKFIADVRSDDRELVIETRRFAHLVIEEEKAAIKPNAFSSSFLPFFSSHKLAVGGIVIIAAAALLIGAFRFFNRNQINGAAPADIKRLTSKGTVNFAVLSPDGKFFAYSLAEKGGYRSSLWVGQTNGGGSDVQLRQADNVAYYPRSFSADGSWLYFLASEPRSFDNATLYKIPALGGVPQKIAAGVSVHAVLSPDEKQIVFVRRNQENKTESLVIQNLDGSETREIAARPAAQGINGNSLSWSADGKMLAFGAKSGNGEAQEIFTANAADGAVTQLTALDWTGLVRVEWRRDGGGLLAVARAKNAIVDRQLWQVEYPSGKARKITRDLQHYATSLSLSADSHALLAVQSINESHIWLAPADNLAAARQITFNSSAIAGWYGVDWTADGKIIYAARVDQSLTIWTMEADGERPTQITSTGFIDERPSATGDGKYIVFQSNRSGASEIWRVNADGADLRQLTFNGGNSVPHVAPDGKTVVYSRESNGASSIWRVAVEGGEPIQITDKPTSNPNVSPDGNFIACGYVSDGKTKLAIVPLSGGEPVRLFDVPATYNFNDSIRWSPDGRFISYRDWANGIWRQAVAGGEPKLLEGLPEEKLYHYRWSPDGKQLAFTRGREVRDVVLMSDFR